MEEIPTRLVRELVFPSEARKLTEPPLTFDKEPGQKPVVQLGDFSLAVEMTMLINKHCLSS